MPTHFGPSFFRFGVPAMFIDASSIDMRRTSGLCRSMISMSWTFFFQAEDGIRYYKVTGVQTCALPIYRVRVVRRLLVRPARSGRGKDCGRVVPGCADRDQRGWNPRRKVDQQSADDDEGGGDRSEERRVGKECRSRWSPDH